MKINLTIRIHFTLKLFVFCFLHIIQQHLNIFRQSWNSHRIRSQRQQDVLSGIPDVMYYQPMVYGCRDCSFPLPCEERILDNISTVHTDSENVSTTCQDFNTLVYLLIGLSQNDIHCIINPDDLKLVYIYIKDKLDTVWS